MDEPILSTAEESNTCDYCKTSWRHCRCSLTNRTESIESLLSNEHLFPDETKRHLCLFAYHNYSRWTATALRDDYTVACTPPWEGWYAAWLKPSNTEPISVGWCEQRVLDCQLQYTDGSVAAGWVTCNGVLYIRLPAGRPPGGRDYDEDRRLLRQRVTVSQMLSLGEIREGRRGTVRGRMGEGNSGRVVSHVLEEKNELLAMAKLPEEVGDAREVAMVEKERVKRFAPYLWDEVRWRTRRRFTREIGVVVQRYLRALFAEAGRSDHAVRYALRRGWREGGGWEKELEKIEVYVKALKGGKGRDEGEGDATAIQN